MNNYWLNCYGSMNTLPRECSDVCSETIKDIVNQLDVYSCQALIKSALDIENEICIKNRITVKFNFFYFIYLNL